MAANRDPVVIALEQALADTYALALKAQNYHWNVEGPNFFSLHGMFEEQYTDAHTAVDELAERIRALGGTAPGGFKVFLEMTNVSDAKDGLTAKSMVADLADGHDAVATSLRDGVSKAEAAGDVSTADMLTGRLTEHNKHAWMLRATNA